MIPGRPKGYLSYKEAFEMWMRVAYPDSQLLRPIETPDDHPLPSFTTMEYEEKRDEFREFFVNNELVLEVRNNPDGSTSEILGSMLKDAYPGLSPSDGRIFALGSSRLAEFNGFDPWVKEVQVLEWLRKKYRQDAIFNLTTVAARPLQPNPISNAELRQDFKKWRNQQVASGNVVSRPRIREWGKLTYGDRVTISRLDALDAADANQQKRKIGRPNTQRR